MKHACFSVRVCVWMRLWRHACFAAWVIVTHVAFCKVLCTLGLTLPCAAICVRLPPRFVMTEMLSTAVASKGGPGCIKGTCVFDVFVLIQINVSCDAKLKHMLYRNVSRYGSAKTKSHHFHNATILFSTRPTLAYVGNEAGPKKKSSTRQVCSKAAF